MNAQASQVLAGPSRLPCSLARARNSAATLQELKIGGHNAGQSAAPNLANTNAGHSSEQGDTRAGVQAQ